jgi:hypothetical protein
MSLQTRPLPPNLTRAIGMTLLGAAVLGLLLSLAGLVVVFTVGRQAEAAFMRELDVLDEALAATSDGLAVSNVTLDDTAATIRSLSQTFVSVSVTITETSPIISTMADLAGQDLPQTVNATRQALDSAQETAQVADGVLGSLSIFGLRYNPEVPLSTAIGEVSTSLEGLPTALGEVSRGLKRANDNLITVAGDLRMVTVGLNAIALSVTELTTVVARYEEVIASLQAEVAQVRAASPGWFFAGRLGLSLLMLWLAVAQLALFSRGWELLQAPRAEEPG